MRMGSARNLIVVGLLAAGLALAFAGCGGIDSGKVEDEITSVSEEEIGPVDSVSCPDDIESETGTTFECEVQFSDGNTGVADAEVTDGDEGNVEFVVRPG
jgi:Domain of unknown function (DUF4333)